MARVESRLAQVEARGVALPTPEESPAARARAMLASRVSQAAETVPQPAPEQHVPLPQPEPVSAPLREPQPVEPRFSLEALIGGRLPIWIGGAALVLAGFFLVRYSIESGLLGPGTRTLLAALFGLLLIAGSEAARRLAATRDDPRVAQALAGAGIASLYGTLYMAAALYHLVSPLPAFVLVVTVTAGAMALALRHGPPTAAMALVGGFVAPLLAGFDAAGIGPLLLYLALFIAALFGLAIRRGWGWLALAAAISGFGWINFLIAALGDRPGDWSAVGAFTMLLAACASVALPATGTRNPWLRLAPLVAGFVQLVALAPSLEFGALAWSFYLVLAAAALFLSWREPLYLPAALAALGFLLVLELLALLHPERSITPLAAVAATLLFALPGHWLASRSPRWAELALGGTAGPLLVAHAAAPSLLAAPAWGVLELLAAAACAHLAWHRRSAGNDSALILASLATALLGVLGLAQFLPHAWLSLPLALAILGLAGWARFVQARALFKLPVLPFAAALVSAGLPLLALTELVAASVMGDRLPYLRLPHTGLLLRDLALPTAALVASLLDPRMLGNARRLVGSLAIAVAVLLLYALTKQPLALATLDRFAAAGFLERALLTQACLAAGWLLLRARRFPSLGGVLLTLGLARFVWFDLLLLSPVFVPQQVGGIPLLNAAVLHAAAVAAWLWTLAPTRPIRTGAALATLVALLAAVRQAAHGSLMTGAVSTPENGGYSAVLLGAALFWLWRGIATGARDLRIAGLALLTAVTFKVFLVDAAALDGVLRILSFLALGIALIGIGWAYNRFLGTHAEAAAPSLDAAASTPG
ncbi:DUF2339 domain-containing protein [Sphingomonas xinjiangensis]|uniref:Putative membrane protein n=1 Tax=Sphingomonas xinjiangensis TaxID=643568 RepID=A0A840YRA5_9SPHN|nr:DUF2339 domain-containing protein [Sphingomonas xinjiangensis]MBB5711932.1 putative membrane protein [Sphingomonas xinjiangensis]